MVAEQSDGHLVLERALAGVDLAAPSTTKFNRLETELSALAGLASGRVVASTISKAGNFGVRTNQSRRAQTAELFVGVVTDPQELEATKRAALAHVVSGRCPAVLLLVKTAAGWAAPWVAAARGQTIVDVDEIHNAFNAEVVISNSVEHPEPGLFDTRPAPGTLTAVPTGPLVIAPRIRRMLRSAVASRAAVMLVGPPGTGKSQLVLELLDEIADDPSIVGMTKAHEPLTTTPDESWTARELVGGETVDDQGRLRFSPGAVLEAITQDRWLVLDEANRADMDRIFGGLLTWLSGQPVTVGRVAGDPAAGPVRLGWATSVDSIVHGLETLRADSPGGDPVDFLAGTEWRLIGTYNALDAQRVFSFGLALGRRFAHVPVPPLTVTEFAEALRPRLLELPEQQRSDVESRVLQIYEAHQEFEIGRLGPAMFLSLPSYIAASVDSDADPVELLAEAYLTASGMWLARFDDETLDRLGTRISAPEVLDDQWTWIRQQLSALM
jgi:hypothetical protein